MIDALSAPQIEETEHYLEWLEMHYLLEELGIEDINALFAEAAREHREE